MNNIERLRQAIVDLQRPKAQCFIGVGALAIPVSEPIKPGLLKLLHSEQKLVEKEAVTTEPKPIDLGDCAPGTEAPQWRVRSRSNS